MSLSILVVTTGRPLLERCLGALAFQLCDHDELVVVADGPGCGVQAQAIWERVEPHLRCGQKHFIVHPDRLGYYGHPLRTVYQRNLGGTYVMHCDDDNFYVPGALQSVREHLTTFEGDARKCMHLFRMVTSTHLTKPAVWRTKEVKRGNIDTGCGVLPNLGAAFPAWPNEYGGDGVFYETMAQLVDTSFVETPIYVYTMHTDCFK